MEPGNLDVNVEELKAPVLFSWHLTNRCNLNCIHCLWSSSPTNAYPNELTVEECLRICEEVEEAQVPYVLLSGGEVLLHPGFWRICEHLTGQGVSVKIETNGLLVTRQVARKLGALGLRSVQISVDGASQETYSTMRPRARLDKVLRAIRHLVDEGIMTELTYVPAKFSLHEVGQLLDKAAELGVSVFQTGQPMYLGRAVSKWSAISITEEEYGRLVRTLEERKERYDGRMRIYYYPLGLTEELRFRLAHPPANPLLMANGKVKLINSVPFVCADVRRHTLTEVWERFRKAWRHPAVVDYVNAVTKDPTLLAKAAEFVELPDARAPQHPQV